MASMERVVTIIREVIANIKITQEVIVSGSGKFIFIPPVLGSYMRNTHHAQRLYLCVAISLFCRGWVPTLQRIEFCARSSCIC